MIFGEDPLDLLVFVSVDAAERVPSVRWHSFLEAGRPAATLLADRRPIVMRPLILHRAWVVQKVHSIHFDLKFN